ncbi:MAG: SWIM zinc finger family protein [Halapricum sp.]
MTTNTSDAVEAIDLENPRAQRALTECMTVLPEGGDVHTVVGEHGRTYTVDAREGRCTCPDAEYNLEDGERCKHQIRTLVAEGCLSVPAWIDRDAVDGLLGTHVDGSPRLVATDGGEVLTADAAAEERPDECECTGHERETLPCWYCYAEGFDEPNPDAGEE